VTSGTVTVAANLVRHLRAGVKREISASLSVLQVEMDIENTDPAVYKGARGRYESATALFDVIGVADDPDQSDIELALVPWTRELFRALESQLDSERMRLERAEEQGLSLTRKDLPGLAELVEEVRRRTGQPSRGERDVSYLERQQRRLPRRRQRGDG